MNFTVVYARYINAGLRQTPARVIQTDFFLPADSLLPGLRPAYQHNRLEELDCVISVPISERMVISGALLTPGMVQSKEPAFS